MGNYTDNNESVDRIAYRRWGAFMVIICAMVAVSCQVLAGGRYAEVDPVIVAVPTTQSAENDVGIDELLGLAGRQKHAQYLAQLNVAGKTFTWQQYVAWGNELYHAGKVAHSPTGKPSEPLSKFYQCTQCHNNVREDVVLTQQDPEARLLMMDRPAPASPLSKVPLWMAPGSTMWGVVNRESFYNDSYEAYHGLTVQDGKEMNPKSLNDATQICGKYCSVGRFMEPWELAALITYFWEIEVKLKDLELPSTLEGMILATLRKPDQASPAEVAKMRDLLRRLYLRRAGDVATHPPKEPGAEVVGPYPDKLSFQGDKVPGEKIYKAACVMCHGPGKPNESHGADLVSDLKYFHQILAVGTEQSDQPYMPRFTMQRLTRQQIADLQAYLLSIKK